MASFKILILRSKKYDFLLLSYLFFFLHLKCLHPLSLLFWTLGKKICGHLAVFQETRLRLNICHIFHVFLYSGKWRSTSLMLSLNLTRSVTLKVWMQNSFCPYLPTFTQIFLFSPSHSFYLSFSPLFTIVLEFFMYHIAFYKIKAFLGVTEVC